MNVGGKRVMWGMGWSGQRFREGMALQWVSPHFNACLRTGVSEEEGEH